MLLGGSNPDRSPEVGSNSSELRSSGKGHSRGVAEGELHTERGGGNDAWISEDKDPGGSPRSQRRKRARRDGGTVVKGGGKAIVDWRVKGKKVGWCVCVLSAEAVLVVPRRCFEPYLCMEC